MCMDCNEKYVSYGYLDSDTIREGFDRENNDDKNKKGKKGLTSLPDNSIPNSKEQYIIPVLSGHDDMPPQS